MDPRPYSSGPGCLIPALLLGSCLTFLAIVASLLP